MSERMDRREFLKVGAVGAVGMSAVSGNLGLASAASGKPIRLGMIGVGGRGTTHLETLLAMGGVEIPASATSTRSISSARRRWWRRPGRSGRRVTGGMWKTTSA